MVTTAVTRLQPGHALEAAGYIRVSRKVQAEGHSPDIQREAIKRLARQEGYILTDNMIEEDHERGSKVTRRGYQRIIDHVREGRVATVIIYMFDRWGRDGAEWLQRAREFDRLGVPIISVQEGRDEGGLIRFIRAGMAEEYSRQLAQRVRPAREKAAREGTHMGVTPYGYKRVYPAHEGSHRVPAGHLVPDEVTAWVVRELFARYAAGGWSVRRLAIWLNSDERIPPPRRIPAWGATTVQAMLRNPVYCGLIRYNLFQRGVYERASKGSVFTAEGRHEALVDREVWETVQLRLSRARRHQTFNADRLTVPLAAGLLRCRACGGTMAHSRKRKDATRRGQYDCLARRKGQAAQKGLPSCAAASYRIDVAHAALLAELRRLRGTPWTPEAAIRLLGPDSRNAAETAAATRRALDHEQESLRRHTRRMSQMPEDPTPEQIVAFREVSAEISARIRALEAQLATMEQRVQNVPALRELHEKFSHTALAAVVDQLAATGDSGALRELALELVASAQVAERRPERRSTWIRLEVTWTPDVQTLLDAGLLQLDAPAAPPELPTPAERKRASQQRYLAKRQAERVARPR